jgi:two-component system NtrC family response regulator
MDGLALLGTIRTRWPDTLVVMMTAYATVRDAVDAMRDGACDYLVKPFGLEEVGRLLRRLLALRNAGEPSEPGAREVVESDAVPGSISLEELERRHIEEVLRSAASLDEAASALGIHPSTLWRKRRRYGIG